MCLFVSVCMIEGCVFVFVCQCVYVGIVCKCFVCQCVHVVIVCV